MVRSTYFSYFPSGSVLAIRSDVNGINRRFLRVGYNHSGKENVINFLNGPMGLANAERTLNYIRIFVEFMTQPEYLNVIPMFSILNEALAGTIGVDTLTSLCVAVSMLVLVLG